MPQGDARRGMGLALREGVNASTLRFSGGARDRQQSHRREAPAVAVMWNGCRVDMDASRVDLHDQDHIVGHKALPRGHKETKIMAALTLGEWRDRTLEQVHFAAKAALDAVVVRGNPRMREYIAAAATGDINQCMAQGPNIDSVRRMAQGMAVSVTAAPQFATIPDTKGELRINNLAEAMQRLRVENALFNMLKPSHVLQPQEVDLFFNKAFDYLVQDGYLTDITEDRYEFLDPTPADDTLRFVKHEGSQCIFGIETKPDGSGVVYAVDLDARRILHGDAEKCRRQPLVRNWATSPA